MNSRHQGRRRLAAILFIPLFLMLSGCLKLHTTIDLHSESEVDLAMVLVDTHGLLNLSETDCREVLGDVPADLVSPFTDESNHAGCQMAGPIELTAPNQDFRVIKDGDGYVFAVDHLLDDLPGVGEGIDLQDPALALFSPDVALTVVFPSPVVSASAGGHIDGNTVTWTGLEILTQDLQARSSQSAKPVQPSPTDATPTATRPTPGATQAPGATSAPEATPSTQAQETEPVSEKGLPDSAVIAIGLGLLAVIFLIVTVARRQRAVSGSRKAHPDSFTDS